MEMAKSVDLESYGMKPVRASDAKQGSKFPILMYHRIATDGPAMLIPYRISPKRFECQLEWLHRQGYCSISLTAFYEYFFEQASHSVPEKLIILTFDDAYKDFHDNAWPLLRRYGFGATVFVPTDYVGGRAEWDHVYGPPAEIMSWEQIVQLSGEGIHFESHGCSHKRLSELTEAQILSDAINSKLMLEMNLNRTIVGYSFPYTASDRDTQELIKGAGYKYAVAGSGSLGDNRFSIPRIEILGHDTLDQFIAKLSSAPAREL
jgi:peptidoglycan/xylan/chitin deacetylase (PgdA/CDA1 family)